MPDTPTTNHKLPGIPQKRVDVFMQAWRAATKYAVTWMHGHAEAMKDPHAKGVMNGAAFDFGQQMKRAWQGDERLYPDLLVSSVDLVVKAKFLERDLAAAVARAAAAEAALRRLGSSEAFTVPFAIRKDASEGAELDARIVFARAALPPATVGGENA